MNWTSPTWQDEYWLKELALEAYEYANFVTGFDSVCVPANCTSLRLAVTKNPVAQDFKDAGDAAQPEIVIVTEGNLAELPSAILNSFRQEGSTHDLVVNWLAADLWEKIQPLLSDWPLDYWSFSTAQTRIDIHLEVPYRLYTTRDAPPKLGNRFSVILVEQSADGELKRVPWRKKSLARILERLEKSLRDVSSIETDRTSRFLSI